MCAHICFYVCVCVVKRLEAENRLHNVFNLGFDIDSCRQMTYYWILFSDFKGSVSSIHISYSSSSMIQHCILCDSKNPAFLVWLPIRETNAAAAAGNIHFQPTTAQKKHTNKYATCLLARCERSGNREEVGGIEMENGMFYPRLSEGGNRVKLFCRGCRWDCGCVFGWERDGQFW